MIFTKRNKHEEEETRLAQGIDSSCTPRLGAAVLFSLGTCCARLFCVYVFDLTVPSLRWMWRCSVAIWLDELFWLEMLLGLAV